MSGFVGPPEKPSNSAALKVGKALARDAIPRQEAAILDLSESAVAAMRSLIAGAGDKDIVGIRIAVCGSGCAGLSYQMGLEAEARNGDTVIQREDVTVFVDEDSGTLLSGTTVDFCCNPEGFIFENPNACGSCGSRSSCGN